MKILHIAPFNVANVPFTFIQAENQLGHQSRLITFGRNIRGYPEDICLDLPFINFKGFSTFKKLVGGKRRVEVRNVKPVFQDIPPVWQANSSEKLFIKFREIIWQKIIDRFQFDFKIDDFDIIQLDGGLGFFRDGSDIMRLKELGKKIICCYTGSDLRTRGVIENIDRISDLNITVEFDHLEYHPKIYHVPFPFDPRKLPLRKKNDTQQKVKIGHAPTNRAAKGSDEIISIVKDLERQYPVELILIEKLPYHSAIERKSECDIFIDQIGDLGYGINSLESLAMGIATCSCLVDKFEDIYPDHPFVAITKDNLKEKLIQLIMEPDFRKNKAIYGQAWVKKYHDPIKVVQRIHELLEKFS